MAKTQYAMVMDLNKCLGCQTCTVACKKLWTDGDGMAHVLEQRRDPPGEGYPAAGRRREEDSPAAAAPGRSANREVRRPFEYDFRSACSRGRGNR
jgi:hypothetical protein